MAVGVNGIMDTKREVGYLISTFQGEIKRNDESIARKEQEIKRLKEDNVILKEKSIFFSKLNIT